MNYEQTLTVMVCIVCLHAEFNNAIVKCPVGLLKQWQTVEYICCLGVLSLMYGETYMFVHTHTVFNVPDEDDLKMTAL